MLAVKAKIAILKILNQAGLLKHCWKTDKFVKVEAGYLYLSPQYFWSSWLRRFDCWEPYVVQALKKEIRSGDKVIEFGSCFGYFSLLLAKLVGKQGKVVGFEPLPHYFNYLTHTLERNKSIYSNLQFINAGIAESDRVIEFSSGAPIYDVLSQVNDIKYPNDIPPPSLPNENHIKTMTLSSIINTLEFVPDCIFLDIEGAELHVFDQIINLNIKPKIIFEHHEQFIGKSRFVQYLEKLENYGYRIRFIDEDHMILDP